MVVVVVVLADTQAPVGEAFAPDGGITLHQVDSAEIVDVLHFHREICFEGIHASSIGLEEGSLLEGQREVCGDVQGKR